MPGLAEKRPANTCCLHADDEDDSDKSLDASLQQALEILDATAVSQAAYWDVNITEFARAPTVKVTDSSTGQASTEAGPVTIAGEVNKATFRSSSQYATAKQVPQPVNTMDLIFNSINQDIRA